MKPEELPVVTYAGCMACGVCVESCPFGCLDLTLTGIDRTKRAYPAMERLPDCTGCGFCARDCPVDAIVMVPAEQYPFGRMGAGTAPAAER